eukprot:6214487-Pleurochrysis_carterae.AAC.3
MAGRIIRAAESRWGLGLRLLNIAFWSGVYVFEWVGARARALTEFARSTRRAWARRRTAREVDAKPDAPSEGHLSKQSLKPQNWGENKDGAKQKQYRRGRGRGTCRCANMDGVKACSSLSSSSVRAARGDLKGMKPPTG